MDDSEQALGGDVDEQSADPAAELEVLEGIDSPSPADVDRLLKRALVLVQIGYADRARKVLQRWRAAGCKDPDLYLAEACLTVSIPASAASHRLRAQASREVKTAALEVVNLFHRGELRSCIELARSHRWFLDQLDATEALSFPIAALALTGRHDEANRVIETWKAIQAERAPAKHQLILRLEAYVAWERNDCHRVLGLLQEAEALCRELKLDTTRAFMEPDLAAAYARVGELDSARQIVGSWPKPDETEACTSPLDGFRLIGLTEVELAAERYAAAFRVSALALKYCQAIANVPLRCLVQFFRLLAAPRSQFRQELEAYRQLACRYQQERHLERLGLLERLVAQGLSCVRDGELLGRSRLSQERLPLLRLWMPRADYIGASIYWDRISSVLYLNGRGPFQLRGHPVLLRTLDLILTQPGYSLELGEVYRAIWGGSYDPLLNEGKVHVTVHRLHSWIAARCGGRPCTFEVRDGQVRFSPELDIRVIDLPTASAVAELQARGSASFVSPIKQRVLQCLAGDSVCSASELAKRVGGSRSALNQTLRELVQESAVTRVGRGSATRYRRGRQPAG